MTQPLNLATQCLDNWRQTPIRNDQMVRLMNELSRELEHAPKFLLPEGGRPIDDPASVARMYLELKLPFDCVVLEYLATGPVGELEVTSRKRIAMAWSLDKGSPPLLERLCGLKLAPRRGFLVQSISYINHLDMWMPICGMVEVDLGHYPGQMRPQELPAGMLELTRHRLRSAGATETYMAQVITTVDTLAAEFGRDRAGQIISADSSDEVLAVLSFSALSGCGNVTAEVLPAPAALNRKREARGRPPLFDTRVLMVTDSGYRSNAAGAVDATRGGTHASPRTHLRRGHVRRLGERSVWVNSALVNPTAGSAPAPRYELLRQR